MAFLCCFFLVFFKTLILKGQSVDTNLLPLSPRDGYSTMPFSDVVIEFVHSGTSTVTLQNNITQVEVKVVN